MKIDTEVRHVTKAGGNLFLELGFSPAEAQRLLAVSRRQTSAKQVARGGLRRPAFQAGGMYGGMVREALKKN